MAREQCRCGLLAAIAVLMLAPGIAAAEVTVSAKTVPYREVAVAAETGRIVTEVLVEEGEPVEKRQELVRLNDALLRAQLRVSMAHIESARHRIQAAVAQHTLLQKEYERELDLFEKDVSSQADLERAKLDMDLAELSIQNAQNELRIAELTAERDRVRLEQTVIRAPYAAQVLRIARREGEAAEPLQPVLSLVTLDPLYVVADVPVETAGRIEPGAQATLALESWPEQRLKCTVVVADSVADPASGTYRVKLRLPNPDGSVVAGTFGTLTFQLTD